jgi:GT2 family glycosyltransferase
LESLKDSRFRIIHQKNSGYVKALNRGAALVKTDYIARLDADDIALPSRLEIQLRFLDAHPEVAVVGSRMRYVFLRRRQFSIGFGKIRICPEFSPPMKNPPFWDPANDGQTIPHPSATMRRLAFERVGGYRNIAPSEDIDLWLRFMDSGYKLACLNEVLLLYRIGVQSESSQGLSKQLHLLKFARYCHECRISGAQEPEPDQYFREFPLTEAEINSLQVKLGIRKAMGKFLSGSLLSGSIEMASLIRRHPKDLIAKFRSRC